MKRYQLPQQARAKLHCMVATLTALACILTAEAQDFQDEVADMMPMLSAGTSGADTAPSAPAADNSPHFQEVQASFIQDSLEHAFDTRQVVEDDHDMAVEEQGSVPQRAANVHSFLPSRQRRMARRLHQEVLGKLREAKMEEARFRQFGKRRALSLDEWVLQHPAFSQLRESEEEASEFAATDEVNSVPEEDGAPIQRGTLEVLHSFPEDVLDVARSSYDVLLGKYIARENGTSMRHLPSSELGQWIQGVLDPPGAGLYPDEILVANRHILLFASSNGLLDPESQFLVSLATCTRTLKGLGHLLHALQSMRSSRETLREKMMSHEDVELSDAEAAFLAVRADEVTRLQPFLEKKANAVEKLEMARADAESDHALRHLAHAMPAKRVLRMLGISDTLQPMPHPTTQPGMPPPPAHQFPDLESYRLVLSQWKQQHEHAISNEAAGRGE